MLDSPVFRKSSFCVFSDNLGHNIWHFLNFMQKNYKPQVTKSQFSSVRRMNACGTDLRLRILGYQDRKGMTHPTQASLDPDNLSFACIYGVHGCEALSTEIGSFNYAMLARFAEYFTKVPIYYDHDCLRKYKMAISWQLAGQRKGLRHFSYRKTPFLRFQQKKIKQVYFVGY